MCLSLGFIVPLHVHLYCILSPFIAYIIGIFLILCKLLLYLLSSTISCVNQYSKYRYPFHVLFLCIVQLNINLICIALISN